jgi:predicted transcriptional regulator
MRFAKVEGYNDLVRDSETGAIINTNKTEYEKYIAQRDSRNRENTKIEKLESDMSSIRNDLNQIKELLRGLSK